MDEDIIADISPERERFFGCGGRMLMPSRATVADYVKTVPPGTIIAMDRLQRDLAAKFGVEVTCPVAARKALEAVAREEPAGVPYWRVVRKTGEMMARFPGGVEGQAERLRRESVPVEGAGKSMRVADPAKFME